MATFTTKCPHCLTQHIALIVMDGWDHGAGIAAATFRCPKCLMPSCAELRAAKINTIYPHDWSGYRGDLADEWSVERGLWPEVAKPLIPEHLPEDIVRILSQAESNFAIMGNEEAAGDDVSESP